MRGALVLLALAACLAACAATPEQQDKAWCDAKGVHEGDSDYVICRAHAAMARQHSGGFADEYHPARDYHPPPTQDALDQQTCTKMGAPPSDPRYFQCRAYLTQERALALQHQQQQDHEQRQRDKDFAATLNTMNGLFQAGTPPPPPPVQPPQPPFHMSCRPAGNQLNCVEQ